MLLLRAVSGVWYGAERFSYKGELAAVDLPHGARHLDIQAADLEAFEIGSLPKGR